MYEIIENLEDLEFRLDDAIDGIDDLTEPLIESLELVQLETLNNFASEGGRTSEGQWEPLKPSYEKWKISRVGGGPILHLEGELIDAVDDPEAIVILSDNEAAYIIDDEKAPWHQSGRERSKGGRLPARPILPDEQFFQEPIEQIFDDWLEDVMNGE